MRHRGWTASVFVRPGDFLTICDATFQHWVVAGRLAQCAVNSFTVCRAQCPCEDQRRWHCASGTEGCPRRSATREWTRPSWRKGSEPSNFGQRGWRRKKKWIDSQRVITQYGKCPNVWARNDREKLVWKCNA